MSAAAKARLTKIEVGQGNGRRLYLVPAEAAQAVETFLGGIGKKSEDFVLATDLFPDLGNPQKTPGIALRGVRLRLGLTQKMMAKKIGVSQGDLSKMEKGLRPIGKKMALRLGKSLRVDYHRFL